MKAGKRVVLGVAAALMAAGCSSGAPEPVGKAAQPLASAPPTLVPQTGPVSAGGARVAVPALPDAGAQSANATQLALGDPDELATLRGIAASASSGAGVSSPTSMQAIAASDHAAAEYRVSGAILNDHAPMYILKIAGGPFTAVQHPPGSPAPQGNFMTVTVDAATHRITDVGFVNTEPDLTQIGFGSVPVDLVAP